MPRYEITSPDGRRFEINAPDGATQEQIMQFAQRQFQSAQAAPNLDVPSPEQDAAVSQYYAQQQSTPKPTLIDYAKKIPEYVALGAPDAGLSMVSAATTGMIGQLAGTLQQAGREIAAGNFGSADAANRIEQRAADVGASATYAPRTQAGQEILGAVGELSEPLAGLTPLMGQTGSISQSARLALQSRVNPSRSRGDIDSTLIVDSPDDARKIAKSRAIPANKLSDPKDARALIDDPLAIALSRQGIDDKFINEIKSLSPADAKQVLKAVATIDRGDVDFMASRFHRPSDAAGESLVNRVVSVKNKNKEYGRKIDEVARSLDGEIDFSGPVNSFIDELDALGVRLDGDLSPNFKGSDTLGADRRVIREVIARMKDAKSTSPQEAHKLKRFIDRLVNYGSTSQGGLGRDTSSALKNLRRNLDGSLDEAFPEYKEVNDSYRETIQALDDIQNAFGKTIRIDDSDAAVGTALRGVLSNNRGRENQIDAISEIDRVAKKYGGRFDDDILRQVAIADELERVYKVQGKTSIGGELGKQAEEIINKGVRGALTDKAFSMIEKSEKQRREESLRALKKMLMSKNK